MVVRTGRVWMVISAGLVSPVRAAVMATVPSSCRTKITFPVIPWVLNTAEALVVVRAVKRKGSIVNCWLGINLAWM